VKNQPSPSLISLSPLIVSHLRALRRAWVRSSGLTSVNLLTIRSLGFGCDPSTIKCQGPTCWPIIQKVRGCLSRQSTDCSFNYLNAFHTVRSAWASFNFPSQYFYVIIHLVFCVLEFDLYVQWIQFHLLTRKLKFSKFSSEYLRSIQCIFIRIQACSH